MQYISLHTEMQKSLSLLFSKIWFPLETLINNKLSTWIFDNWLSSGMFIKSRSYKGTLPFIHRHIEERDIVLRLSAFTVLPNTLFQICPNSPVSQLSCIF